MRDFSKCGFVAESDRELRFLGEDLKWFRLLSRKSDYISGIL